MVGTAIEMARRSRRCLLAAACVALAGLLAASAQPGTRASAAEIENANPPRARAFDPGRVGFSVTIDGVRSDFRVFSLFALPGERMEVRASAPVEASARVGAIDATPAGFVWTAPERPGSYVIDLAADGRFMRLNAFVMRPATEIDEGWLSDYRIDDYPKPREAGRAVYRRPRGFVVLTDENADMLVSPHFRLEQFECHQFANGDRFLALRPELLLKLERILEEVNKAGYRASGFYVQSGYRTPFYNRAIGNEMLYSRHMYGDAADILIDENGDGLIDDLNGDGISNLADAAVLYDLVERISADPEFEPPQGGLGEYAPAALRGAFIHVDGPWPAGPVGPGLLVRSA